MIIQDITFIALMAFLNHLGGQDTLMPNPRMVFRMVAMPLCVRWLSILYGLPDAIWVASWAAIALWAVFAWGEMFMALEGYNVDSRQYNVSKWKPDYWLTKATDFLMGTHQADKLTLSQLRNWATVYGALRGGVFLYPLFIYFGFMLTPWAFLIGLGAFSQGIVYRFSSAVLYAEPKFGAIIGAMIVLIFTIAG